MTTSMLGIYRLVQRNYYNIQKFATIFVIMCVCLVPAHSSVRLTNIECHSKDTDFIEFTECALKVLKRNVVSLHIYCKVHKLPIQRVTINLDLLRKYSGYKPFLYNMSTDFCKFMSSRSRHPFLKFFIDILQRSSNINHSCPYNHHIIVDNLVPDDTMFKIIPLPTGEYLFKLAVKVEGIWIVTVNAYFSKIDEK